MAHIGNNVKAKHQEIVEAKQEQERIAEVKNNYNNLLNSNAYTAEQFLFRQAMIDNKDKNIVEDIFKNGVDFNDPDQVRKLGMQTGYDTKTLKDFNAVLPNVFNDFVASNVGTDAAVKLDTYDFMDSCSGMLILGACTYGLNFKEYSGNTDFGTICCS